MRKHKLYTIIGKRDSDGFSLFDSSHYTIARNAFFKKCVSCCIDY